MAEVLVLVEHIDGETKKVTLELLTLARRLGTASAVVLAGPGKAEKASTRLAEFGAEKVYVVEAEEIDGFLIAPQAEALAAVIGQVQPAAVLVASSIEGKEIAARTALKIGSGIVTDAVDVAEGFVATQNIYGGAVIVHSHVSKGTPVITVRPNSVAPEAAAGAGTVEQVSVTFSDAAKAAKVVEHVVEAKSGRPDLTEASIVVSGGRGVNGADNMAIIETLADSLGAAVGASRAVVDAGWYPNQYQVGQTGKTVSPQLYIAVGISGAIQHRAGMQTSKTIVAINKDAEAPIFELADFGLVGDLFTVAPALAEEIKKRKG